MVNQDLTVLGDLAYEWPELKSMRIMVNIRQGIDSTQKAEMSVRFYISSRDLSAKELHDSTRAHWLVESMHWQLDVAFKEDACRIRVDGRVGAFSRIRQVCLNLLKQEKGFKGGITRKRMMCEMDENYLSKVLGSVA